MKKLLGIVVLGLLISACSNNKLKTSLEKCATQTFVDEVTYMTDYVSSKSEGDNEIIQYKTEIKTLENQIEQLIGDRNLKKKKWKNDNKEPPLQSRIGLFKELGYPSGFSNKFLSLPREQQTIVKDLVKKKSDQQKAKFREWTYNYSNIASTEQYKIKTNSKRIDELKRSIRWRNAKLAEKRFLNFTFEEKKEIPEFMNVYQYCEKEYNETPNTFFEKWNN